MREISLTLPWPPSSNKIWRQGKNRIYLLANVKNFRKEVKIASLNIATFGKSRLGVEIYLFPPDKRRRDIDNTIKSLLDALQHAGVYDDDVQIQKLTIEKMSIVENGKVEVRIEELL